MKQANPFRTRTRNTHGSRTLPRLWAAFMIAALVASFYSALIPPVSAAPDDVDEPPAAAEQGDLQPLDSDGDGLSDDQEASLGTDPNNPDTDFDGTPDGQDADPFNPPQPVDSDGDGLDDATEGSIGTDPNNPDTDFDGVMDGQDDDPLNAVGEEPTQSTLQEEPGNLTIEYRACPQETDFSTETGQSLNQLCDRTALPATFSLLQGQVVASQQANAAPSSVFFDGIAPGDYQITQDPMPIGFAAWCEGFAQSNTKPYDRFQAVSGATINMPVLAGETINCDWFVLEQAPENGNSVTVYKWQCPEGTLYFQADPSYYSAECDTEHLNVPITLTDANGPRATTTQANGTQWDNVVPNQLGIVSIAEEIPDGYGDPMVFCQNNATEPQPDAPTNVPAAGGRITLQPQAGAGFEYQCFWYNIPAQPGTITLYKWECPQGTMYGQADPAYYSAECATEQPGVDFTLTDGNGTTPFQSDTNGQQLDDVIPDSNGEISIAEEIPEGFGAPVVFCQNNGEDPQPDQPSPVTVTNGSITIRPSTSPFEYQCFWYNLPLEEYTVTVYKWQCPEGTLYGQTDPEYYSAECATEQPGVDFTLTDGNGTTPFQSDTNGQQLEGVIPDANGAMTITELVPEGYGDPVRFCWPLNYEPNGGQSQPWQIPAASTSITVPLNQVGEYDLQCWFYNIPYEYGDVTIYKYECPEGVTPEWTYASYSAQCTAPMQGVEFSLETATDSTGFTPQVTDAAGMAGWQDVPGGPLTITETIPPGYDKQPFVACRVIAPEPDAPILLAIGEDWTPVDTINGAINLTLQYGYDLECHVFNRYLGPGEITVYKFTCPEGYDRHAWGANPIDDCTEATNGITFVLDQPDPDVDLQSDTGDSVNGAVYFGGLEPGTYTLREIVPDTIGEVFIWDCYGLNTSSVHPRPLVVGSELTFPIAGGDRIECYWYNVPMRDPGYGWMIVRKFNCTTPTYVSDVECYTYEGGQGFEVQIWNGSTWTTVQSGTTNVSGQVTFTNLEPGDYRLIEPGKTACLMKSGNITPGGNIGVVQAMGTTVHVYNCSQPTKPPGKPTKYPNTGVPPAAEIRTAHDLDLLGLLGLTGAATLSRRSLLRRAAVGATLGAGAIGGGSVALSRAFASQTLVPIDATITPEGSPATTQTADCLYPATPEPVASTPEAGAESAIQSLESESTPEGTPLACARGAVPVNITIPVIEVDYPIEFLEIIEGEMQQPTGADAIAWYKSTARLGERGNAIFAGHLNWWDQPEGPFFRLETLTEGDLVEIEGDDGEICRYIVQWTQDFPIDEEPPEEALGQTDEEVITLITCGGEWDASVALYDHRTLVRAIRDVAFAPGTPAPGGTPPA